MKTISFLAQKGGSGKTTLAVHIAVAAQEAGERVLIVDTDPQRSASVWGEAREKLNPKTISISASGLKRALESAVKNNITLVIIDTAPHAAPAAAQIARLSDLVVIPCRPTAFDLAAVRSAVAITEAANADSVFVLSACPIRAPEIGEARSVLEEYSIPVSKAEIGDRRAFSRAIATGRSVTEFESKGKSADETRALWKCLKRRLS